MLEPKNRQRLVCLVFFSAPRSLLSENTSLPAKSMRSILTLPPSWISNTTRRSFLLTSSIRWLICTER